MREPMDQEEQDAAIQMLRDAGFMPDGQAWRRQRFSKPGSRRKATVGGNGVYFYEVPAPGKMRMVAMMPTSNLLRIRLVAFQE